MLSKQFQGFMVRITYRNVSVETIDYSDEAIISIVGNEIIINIPSKGKEYTFINFSFYKITDNGNGTKLIEIFI
ncbi:MAG: hypothetical protein PVJ67_05105 [Candidatus Pacearchaeota archaeon]|jgi:hypothetical protein